jgi:hypothetical protein
LEVLFRKKEMTVMKRTILSLGVVAALAANTYGAGSVWYSATSNGGTALVDQQGAPGVQTKVSCGATGSWAITVHYTLTDGGATSWALDHYGNTPFTTVGGLAVPSTGFAVGVNVGTNPNAGGELLKTQSGQDLSASGVGPGDFILETWTLSSSNCSGNVLAGIGGIEFGGNDPDGFDSYEVVGIGNNVPRPGFSLGSDPTAAELNPVIVITPEPTTLSLLALGALAMIRRRK